MASSTTLSSALVSPTIAAETNRSWQAIPARPYQVRGADRRLLARAEQFVVERQWNDALAAITRLLRSENSSMVALGRDHPSDHFVSLREYCHRLLSQFPAEPLKRYRQLVDAASKAWYQQGIAERDEPLLQKIVDESFCSSWGDDALLALGELALERGDYQAARNAWLRIGPQMAEGTDQLTYPDTTIALATVQARLVLVSLRENDWRRAEKEWERLSQSFPTATGRLGGRQVILSDHLAELMQKARQWPPLPTPRDWPTFAASPQRTNAQDWSNRAEPYELLWSQSVKNERLSIFPIVVDDLVVYQDDSSVWAWSLTDGQLAFRAEGEAFQSPARSTAGFGQLRHTLTAVGSHIFGITTAALGPGRKAQSSDTLSACWCLDLQREGALEFRLLSDDPAVAFVGTPLIVENRLLIACRGNNQTARAGVACYDLETHARLWQRWLCQANTPATGNTSELVTNLLSHDGGMVYCTTNLGAIAAVRVDDGQVLWLRTYERQNAALSRAGDCAYYRGPSPCIYYRGTVLALPTDSNALMAFDAGTGRELWRTRVADPQAKLLGVTDDRVALSNGGLQVCDITTGKLAAANATGPLAGWPALQASAGGGHVWWPNRHTANSFDLTEASATFGGFVLPEPGGGNLLATGNWLVVAGSSQLAVFGHATESPKNPQASSNSSKE